MVRLLWLSWSPVERPCAENSPTSSETPFLFACSLEPDHRSFSALPPSHLKQPKWLGLSLERLESIVVQHKGRRARLQTVEGLSWLRNSELSLRRVESHGSTLFCLFILLSLAYGPCRGCSFILATLKEQTGWTSEQACCFCTLPLPSLSLQGC